MVDSKKVQRDFIGDDGVQCPKRFKENYAMKRHKFRSTVHGLAERNFKCVQCPKDYHSSENLQKHIRLNHPKPTSPPVAETSPVEVTLDTPPITPEVEIPPVIDATQYSFSFDLEGSEMNAIEPLPIGMDPVHYGEQPELEVQQNTTAVASNLEADQYNFQDFEDDVKNEVQMDVTVHAEKVS